MSARFLTPEDRKLFGAKLRALADEVERGGWGDMSLVVEDEHEDVFDDRGRFAGKRLTARQACLALMNPKHKEGGRR